MDHERCKQHPRSMPAEAMAAIRVRQSRRWMTCGRAYARPPARPAKTLLINAGMKYGGHLLKKFLTGAVPGHARDGGGRAKPDDTG